VNTEEENEVNESDAFTEAQNAQTLLTQIHNHAAAAVKYGHVNRDWVNATLVRLGAEPVTGHATYKLMAPITGYVGKTVTAANRADALAEFEKAVQYTLNSGKVDGSYGMRVFQIKAADGETGGKAVFFDGPQDVQVPDEPVNMSFADLKTSIRNMLKEGVAERGWGYTYAANAAVEMGLEPLPALVTKTVQVPVSGLATVDVQVFEGSQDEEIQRATAAKLNGAQALNVKPEEMGEAQWARSTGETMGLHLVGSDEDDEDDDEMF